ncbi:hypothetical protein LTR97_001290 [Elasticomyces elasticus]|uniref:Uncharacterized protein n=1 Tax=Elasticomyces elasticus TaxID=574655 RepID=A0AAN7VVY7_9PEZI|nr:hypothetical protein LTR97_001290 [Elasticomyces elasticus]
MGHTRPWNKHVVTAGVLVTLIVFFFGLQHQASAAPLRHGKEDIFEPSTSTPASSSRAKRKAIITSVQREDETTADWVAELLPGWESAVYVTDRRPDEEATAASSLIRPHSLPVNRGREASVYLTYIIQHYYTLPDYMVFVHGKRYQMHNDDPMLDTFPEIDRLNLDYVSEQGYTSLRCNWMHACEPQLEPVHGYEDGLLDVKGLYATAWQEFFLNETLPEAVGGPCCAQFAVTKEAVQRWPIDKYERIRHWVWTVDVGEASYKAGLILEYTWHIIFGKPAMFCPDAEECYCRKWGLCGLECPREGWCNSRVWANPEKLPLLSVTDLPDGWPERGQGHKNDGGYLPYDKWWLDEEEVLNH